MVGFTGVFRGSVWVLRWLGVVVRALKLIEAFATDSVRGVLLSRSRGADATVALGRLMGYIVVAVRAVMAAVGAVASLLSLAPPARVQWVLPAVVVNCLWAVVFVAVVLKWGLRPWSMAVDVALAVGFAVAQGRLVSAAALPDGGGWVAPVCSITLITAHLAWRMPAAVAAGGCIAVSYVVGAGLAGTPDRGIPQLIAFSVQIVVTAVLMRLLRRASDRADEAIARYHDSRREARIRRAVRGEEREQNRRLHDKVLGVLTPVGAGDIRHMSPALQANAADALAVITDLNELPVAGNGMVRLDTLVGTIADPADGAVRVHRVLEPVVVPAVVATAFAGAVEAALLNVVAHAQVDQARVVLTQLSGLVEVRIADAGRGFDVATVPPYRYGLREAIRGRMATVGGGARVYSTRGMGTEVQLWWRSDG
jgi:signal transduction histidine kinase